MIAKRRAKGARGEKTEAIRAYLRKHPDATPSQIVAALKKQGIRLSASYASKTRSQARTKRKKPEPPTAIGQLRLLRKTVIAMTGKWSAESVDEVIGLLQFLKELVSDAEQG